MVYYVAGKERIKGYSKKRQSSYDFAKLYVSEVTPILGDGHGNRVREIICSPDIADSVCVDSRVIIYYDERRQVCAVVPCD